MANRFLLFVLLMFVQNLWAQPAIELDEVIIPDRQLSRYSDTNQVILIDDSLLQSRPSLTSVLNYLTPIYFKENGFGMVSSPAFRGTTAQQTAVIWNGINMNSQLNGQTDFNSVGTQYSNMQVRAGGGSVMYGSSAIGGSVHLNNEFRFAPHTGHRLSVEVGSFETYATRYQFAAGDPKHSVYVNVSRRQSQNSFRLPNGQRNLHGEFENLQLSSGFGYKAGQHRFLLYAELFESDRNFSLITPSDNKSNYTDFSTKQMIDWQWRNTMWSSSAKIAYVTEDYTFLQEIESNNESFGNAQSLIAKYDLTYSFSNVMTVNAVTEFINTTGKGTDIDNPKRQIGAASAIFKHQLSKWQYEASIRQEITDNYDSPLLYAAGLRFAVTPAYAIKANASKNFRIPTFNDLYWQQSGNITLKPEVSHQVELGHEINWKNKKVSLTAYIIDIDDMIQWLPGTTSAWHPRNVKKVKSYGVEAIAHSNINVGKHQLSLDATYAYTKSESNGYQLIYVPVHKATGLASYQIHKWSINAQLLYVGRVHTRSDNNPRFALDDYLVTDAGLSYSHKKISTGLQIRNIANVRYQVMADRYFPGRHFNVYFNLNL